MHIHLAQIVGSLSARSKMAEINTDHNPGDSTTANKFPPLPHTVTYRDLDVDVNTTSDMSNYPKLPLRFRRSTSPSNQPRDRTLRPRFLSHSGSEYRLHPERGNEPWERSSGQLSETVPRTFNFEEYYPLTLDVLTLLRHLRSILEGINPPSPDLSQPQTPGSSQSSIG